MLYIWILVNYLKNVIMTALNFSIKIKAQKEKVWTVLWTDETYRKWSATFCEGSYAESNWNEGDPIHFLTPKGQGMFSVIETKIPNKFMAFKHLGDIKDFKEVPNTPETEAWSGAMETYQLTEEDGYTILETRVDVVEKHIDYFKTAFPRGLEKIKELSEEK